MIDVKEFIKENTLTEKEIERFIEDLKDELIYQKQEKYNQKVDAVRDLLQEMAEKYPLELAIEADGIRAEVDLDWEELFTLFENTRH